MECIIHHPSLCQGLVNFPRKKIHKLITDYLLLLHIRQFILELYFRTHIQKLNPYLSIKTCAFKVNNQNILMVVKDNETGLTYVN